MRRSDLVLNLALGVLSFCAIIVTGLVVRREFFSIHPKPSLPQEIHDWRRYASEGHRMGSATAPVTIVVFSDFQCPFCAATMKELGLVRRAHLGNVAVVYRHYPVPGHAEAIAAARASECASDQGYFENFSNALFAEQDSIGLIPWESFATRAGVPNIQAFNSCNARTDAIPAVARDTVAGNKLGVRGTPTLLVNEFPLEGTQPIDSLEKRILQALHSGA